MAYMTIAEAKAAFRRSKGGELLRKSATEILNEETASVKSSDHFDVFLSHCMEDADVIGGVKVRLEEQGQKVYVDWIVDNQLDRAKVTPATADLLRRRMRSSKFMIFATSKASPDSKWMPWELGYFDGFSEGRIAVLPLVAYANQAFNGQEYIGLYPKYELLEKRDGTIGPYITKGKGTPTYAYMDLGSFKSGGKSFKSFG